MTSSGVRIARGLPSSSGARRLIAALNAEIVERYPEEADSFFDLEDEEVAPGVGAFLLALLDGQVTGCGAVRLLTDSDAEIKRMYVSPESRGHGVGRLLLEALEAEARALGAKRLLLETGDRLCEAVALYTSAGFVAVPCVGQYAEADQSLCMAKTLE